MLNDQGQPESQTQPTGDATSTADNAAEAPVSQTQPTTPEVSRVSVVDGYISAKNAALNGKAAEAPTEPQGQPGDVDAIAEPEVDLLDIDADPDAPTDPTPAKTQEFRPRLGKFDARKQEAILLAKDLLEQGQEISLSEAEQRVNAKYGVSDASAEKSPAADETPVRSITAVREEIAELKKEQLQAADDMDTRRMIEINSEIESKRDEIYDLRDEERNAKVEAKQQQLTAAEIAAEAANQSVLDHYPAANDANHAIHAKADEISARLQQTGNPMLESPDAAWRIYQMAANELGIAPIVPGSAPATVASPPKPSPTATPKPQAVQQHAVTGRPTPAVAPASGAARQHQPGPTPAISTEKIRTVNDYNKLKHQLVGA